MGVRYADLSGRRGIAVKSQDVAVDLPLLDTLRQLAAEAARLLPSIYDSGFGLLGLLLEERLDQWRYYCTPLNCRTFAATGGDGTHFSLLVRDARINDQSPVVMTVPPVAENFIVGESLFDFLCLGYYRGYFGLEQLSYHREETLEAYINPAWRPSETRHHSVGFVHDDCGQRLLALLVARLNLQPWPDARRFEYLQKRYMPLLDLPLSGE
jgi:hypothetical protein